MRLDVTQLGGQHDPSHGTAFLLHSRAAEEVKRRKHGVRAGIVTSGCDL